MSFNRKLIFIAFTGTLLAIFWQEYNSIFLDPSESYRYGMIQTADEASYFSPVKNFLQNGVWADNSVGNSRYFQRPPGYGMIYGTLLLVFGKYSLAALKIIQISLFFLSVLLLGKILNKSLSSEKWALSGAAFFGFMPMFSGFMYFTLTEAVSPFLLLWVIYSYQLVSKNGSIQLLISVVMLLLVRPQLMIFPIALFLLALVVKERKKSALILLGFLPFAFWMIRSSHIAGEFQGLHPIYSNTNNSLYRPGHEAMTNLFRVWESDGEQFHTTISKIRAANDTNDFEIVLASIPQPFRVKVTPIFYDFNALLNDPEYALTQAFNDREEKFIERVESTRKQLISENKLQYYIFTPLKSTQYLLSKSQLNLYIFQEEFRGNPIMECLRVISVLTISIGFLMAAFLLFQNRYSIELVLSITSLIYLFYLIYFQRLNEERYLTPILPILVILIIIGAMRIVQKTRMIRSKLI